jgi:putative transposase
MDELAGLPEEARRLAMERFRLLQPHLELDEPLTSVARATGIPYRTAHRLVSEYRRHGLVALVRKKRLDRGQRRAVSEPIKEAIEGLCLQKPPLPIATLYRQIVKLARDRGEQAPSYGTVFNILQSLPADLVTLAHEGTKAYSNTFELVHRREAERPNSIWQADHTPLDILLVRPDGRTASPGSQP